MSSPNETDDETLRSPLLFVHQFKYEMDHFPLNCDDITAPTAGSAGQCFDSSRIVDARCRLGALSCVKIRLEIVITVLLHDVIQGKSLALSNSFDRSIISNISNYLFLSSQNCCYVVIQTIVRYSNPLQRFNIKEKRTNESGNLCQCMSVPLTPFSNCTAYITLLSNQ